MVADGESDGVFVGAVPTVGVIPDTSPLVLSPPNPPPPIPVPSSNIRVSVRQNIIIFSSPLKNMTVSTSIVLGASDNVSELKSFLSPSASLYGSAVLTAGNNNGSKNSHLKSSWDLLNCSQIHCITGIKTRLKQCRRQGREVRTKSIQCCKIGRLVDIEKASTMQRTKFGDEQVERKDTVTESLAPGPDNPTTRGMLILKCVWVSRILPSADELFLWVEETLASRWEVTGPVEFVFAEIETVAWRMWRSRICRSRFSVVMQYNILRMTTSWMSTTRWASIVSLRVTIWCNSSAACIWTAEFWKPIDAAKFSGTSDSMYLNYISCYTSHFSYNKDIYTFMFNISQTSGGKTYRNAIRTKSSIYDTDTDSAIM